MTSFNLPGEALKFSTEEEKNLGGLARDLVQDLEQQHDTMFRDIDVHWDWYEGKPMVDVRTDPWPNAANVVVPLTRIASDAIIARYSNTIFASKKIWTGSTQNETFKEFVTPIIDFLNWAADGNEFDAFTPIMDWLTELVPIGSSVMGLGWQRKDRWVYTPGQGGKPTPRKVTFSRGPTLEHIPRNQIIWQAGRNLQDSSIVVRQGFMTRADLNRQVQFAGWNEEAVQKSSPSTGGAGMESYLRRLENQGIDGQGPASLEPHDIREVWVELPFMKGSGLKIAEFDNVDTDVPTLPIVVTIDMSTGSVLRTIAKPYPIAGWPFYDVYMRRRPGNMGSTGMAKLLDHPQRAATTMVNQAIDAITLANSIAGMTQDVKVTQQQFSPNRWMLVDDISETTPFNLSKVIVPDVTLINMMVAFGERLSGIGDPALGRETRLGGHPQPATSGVIALQESNKLFASGLRSIRVQLSRVAEDIATLYQFFGTEDVDATTRKITRAIGPKDASKVLEWIFPQDQPIAGNLEFDLHAVSETMNPEVEAQKAVLLGQMTGNYYSQILQGLTLIERKEVGPLGTKAIIRSMEALTLAYSKFLDAAEVDEIEVYLFKLKESNDEQQSNFAGQFSQFVQGAGGELPGVAGGNAVGAAPAQPNGSAPGVPGTSGSGL